MQQRMPSQDFARNLLSAWVSADPRSIRCAADQAEAVTPASTFEAEQIEMICAAGRVLRDSAQGSAAGAELDASLHLLRHLAGN
jgi:hypothetical protein